MHHSSRSNNSALDTDKMIASMKESPISYTNPFLSDEENDKINFWNNPELEHSIAEDETFRKSVPSDYVDKNVLPELIACYEESGFHAVKDICVDEGLPYGDKHDDAVDSKQEQLGSLPLEDCYINADLSSVTKEKPSDDHMKIGFNHDSQFLKHERMKSSSGESDLSFETKENSESYLHAPEATNDHGATGICDDMDIRVQNGGKDYEGDAAKECPPDNSKLFLESKIVQNSENHDPDNLMHTSEGNIDSGSILLNDSNCVNDVDQELLKIQNPEESLKIPLAESEAEELETSNQTSNISKELPLETQSTPNVTMADHLQHGEGDSSFSMAGHVSGLITHSGPIAYSGSISHRSDSSATSARSFAFPVLQTEWNSSPVRMAKADTRRSLKRRGWRKVFLCCRF